MSHKSSLVNILGINITNLSREVILEKIISYLGDNAQHYIITPNPEIILKALVDEEYFVILNSAKLAIADGIGLKFASWTLWSNLKKINGSDITTDLLRIFEQKGIKVGIINWNQGLSNKNDISKFLDKKYPDLKYCIQDVERDGGDNFQELNNFLPQILFVTLGAPWQEKFMYHKLKQIFSVRVALGAGGSFDFLTGKIIRAPKIIRKAGFEWLWRIFLQPKGKKLWRFKRIYNATFVFVYKFLIWRFIQPWIYRKNVACFLFKKEQNKFKVLLVERADYPGHWQIPQGGTDGQKIKDAGVRELNEETNCNKFIGLKVYPFIHKYKFSEEISQSYRQEYLSRQSGYKGQRQALFIAKFTGEDKDIKVNFYDHKSWKWVDINNAVSEVHECRKKAMKKYVELFKQIKNN